nr:transposase [Rhizobium favelukesii]
MDESSPGLQLSKPRLAQVRLDEPMAYRLKRQDGFSLFLDDGRVDIDSNLVENAIRSPADGDAAYQGGELGLASK